MTASHQVSRLTLVGDKGEIVSEIGSREIQERIDRLPRVRLAHLPTPLEEMPRLSDHLGGPRMLIKRDDCTGLAFGGNKTRHNEFVLGRALEEGADTLVWGAGVQSNNCRQTAAAAAKLGLECHLTLTTQDSDDELQGNLLLDHLVGAHIELTSDPMGPAIWRRLEEKTEALRRQGRKVFTVADPRARAAAAVSYTLAVLELLRQLQDRDLTADAVYFSSAGSTGAGIFLGKKLLGWEATLKAIMPIQWPFDTATYMAGFAQGASEMLGLDSAPGPEEINLTGDFIGEGYGLPTPGSLEAIRLLAQNEGILLDPVYTGKAMAGLIHDIREGRWTADQTVIFLHTGGTPALFAYHRDLAKLCVE